MPSDSREVRRLAIDLGKTSTVSAVNARIAVKKTCADTKADAQSIVAVDTGNLKSSITYETSQTKTGASGLVGPTADYGMFVEAGTSRMPPQPYMRPAFDRRAPQLEEIMAQLKTGEIQ